MDYLFILNINKNKEIKLELIMENKNILKLKVIKGKEKSKIIIVNKFPFYFGRANQCDWCFKDIGISRTHFLIDYKNNKFILKDLGSTNGTFINNKKVIDPEEIHNKDKILVGKVLLLEVIIESNTFKDYSNSPTKIIDGTSILKITHLHKKEEREKQDIKKIIHKVTLEETGILMETAQLHHSYRALKTLYEIVQCCNKTIHTDNIFDTLIGIIFKRIKADRGCIIFYNIDKKQLEVKASLKWGDNKKIEKEIDHEIIKESMNKGSSLIKSIKDKNSIICSPLISHNNIFGVIYLERYIKEFIPFRTEDLELLSAIGVQIGTSLEKSLLLEEIQKVNTYLKSVIECVPHGIYTLDLKKTFTSWNNHSEKIFGYKKEEIIGKCDISIVFPNKEDIEEIFNILNQKGEFSGELNLIKKDKTLFPCRFGISKIIDNKNNLIGYTGFYQDITEEKKVREQIFAQEKMAALGVLAAGVTHDFNNFLNLIEGYASIALEQKEIKNIKKYIEKIISYVRKASDISKNLLRYSRKDTKNFQEGDVLALLKEVLVLVEKELKANSIELERNFSPLKPQLVIPGQLQEVFLNIILNARDAMKNGGKLKIKTWVENDQNIIVFEDTGEGISKQDLKRIFEPFFTTKVYKNQKEGSGLGLAISYQIIKNHGGEIKVQSDINKGTIFKIILPIKKDKDKI